MATARTSKNLANRDRARERRLALQAEQIKRDELIDTRAAEFLDLIDERDAIKTMLAGFDTRLAAALTALMSDGGLTTREVQTLLEIDAGEVKRLRSMSTPRKPRTAPTAPEANDGEHTNHD